MVSQAQRATVLASTVGAFVAAGLAAKVVNTRQRNSRRSRRADAIEFGSLRGDVKTVVARDGVRLNVEVDEAVDGSDQPTLVFVHGWTCNLDTWHYQRLDLRGRFRLVLFDQRSHGGSGRSRRTNSTFSFLADDLYRVLEKVVPTGPVVLIGHSMGGITIQQLAADHSELFGDRIVGVVLLSTSSGGLLRGSPGLERLAPILRYGTAVLDWGRSFNSYSVVRRWAVGPDAPERYADMANEMIRQAPTHVLLDFYPAFTDLDLRGSLDVIGKAVTTVACGTQDLLTPIKHSERLASAIPGARLVAIEGAGHMVMLEEHEAVTEVIEDVVARVQGDRGQRSARQEDSAR